MTFLAGRGGGGGGWAVSVISEKMFCRLISSQIKNLARRYQSYNGFLCHIIWRH